MAKRRITNEHYDHDKDPHSPNMRELRYIGMLITNRDVCEQWVRDNNPPVEAFTPVRQRLVRRIRDYWLQHQCLLTRETNDKITEEQLPAFDRVTDKTIHSEARYESNRGKVDDVPMLIKSIAEKRDLDARRALLDAVKPIIKGKGDAESIEQAQKVLAELRQPLRPRGLRKQSSSKDNHVTEPPVIIEGLLRQGEVANIVSGPKLRKSWAVGDLALCAANGLKWLGHFQCQPTKVLLIDNELKQWTLRKRFATLRGAKGLPEDAADFDYVALREDGAMDIHELVEVLEEERGYGLIILDALYRFFPDGFDENSNADVTRLYNTLDGLARKTGAAVVIVHHASKGNQQGKSTTDMGSGAGAQSRAADAHIVLKAVTPVGEAQEDAPDRATLTAVVRSFAPVDKVHLEWHYPFWTATGTPPPETADAKTRKPPQAMSPKLFAETFANEAWDSRAAILERAAGAGVARDRARDLFNGARTEGHLEEREERDGRARKLFFRFHEPHEAGALNLQIDPVLEL